MLAGNCFLCTQSCEVGAKWRIPLPNSSSSFEVFGVFWDGNFDDIRRVQERRPLYSLVILLVSLWPCHHTTLQHYAAIMPAPKKVDLR